MTIINMNLTEYMGPDKDAIKAYAEDVDQALRDGRINPPLTTRCAECGEDLADKDKAYDDEYHIIILTTSDTVAVVVACEGYFMVDPNLVGTDSPGWMSVEDQVATTCGDEPAEVTGVHDGGCNGDHAEGAPCN